MSHLFKKFGGHYHAVGFTLDSANLGTLKSELEVLAETTLSDTDLVQTIDVDVEVLLQDITFEMIRQITVLSPFGEGNQAPAFLARSMDVIVSRIVGDKHLKLTVRQGEDTVEAIGFGLADRHPLHGKRIDMVFIPEINKWQGHESIQLRIIDLDLN